MRRYRSSRLWVPSLAWAVLLAMPSVAQDNVPPTFSAVYHVTVKAGMAAQFEDGMKKHAEFHRGQNDPNGYAVTFVEMGDGFGEYHIIVGNRQLADFDVDSDSGAADTTDFEANVAPFVASTTARFSIQRAGLSYPPEEGGAGLSWVTYVELNPGGASDYGLFRGKLREAIRSQHK